MWQRTEHAVERSSSAANTPPPSPPPPPPPPPSVLHESTADAAVAPDDVAGAAHGGACALLTDGERSACAQCLSHLAAIRPGAPWQANYKHRQAILLHVGSDAATHERTSTTVLYVQPVPTLLRWLHPSASMCTVVDDDDDDDDDHRTARGRDRRVATETEPVDHDVLLGVYFEVVCGESGMHGRSLLHYRRAARRGVAIAQFNVARRLYRRYNNAEQTESFRTFDALARRGHVDSLYFAASCYSNGYGVDVDVRRAGAMLRRIAALDECCPFAQFDYALCLHYGEGVVCDRAAANELFVRVKRLLEDLARRDDDRRALTRLGYMHTYGHGCKQNDVEAMRHYEAAAARGSVGARRLLAMARLYGWFGLAANAAEAMSQLTQLAVQGNRESMYCLGEAYARGCAGVPEDPCRAVQWFERAVHAGGDCNAPSAKSFNALASYCEHGDRFDGMRTDTARAGLLYLEAARRGHGESQHKVADAYCNGRLGFDVDNVQAVRWLSEAAYGGDVRAQTDLTFAYDNELLGLRCDGDAMYDLSVRGVAMGDAVAVANLGGCYASGYGVAADPVQAGAHMRRSAEMGCADAHWGLAYASRHGDERYAIGRDAAAAHRHTCAAARLGCDEARQYLREQCACWTPATTTTTMGERASSDDGNDGDCDNDVLRIELPWVRDAFLRSRMSPSPLTLRVLLSRAAVVARVMRHHATSPLHRSRGAMCDAMFAETLLAFVCSEYVAEAGVVVAAPATALLAVVRCVGTPAFWCTSSAELVRNAYNACAKRG